METSRCYDDLQNCNFCKTILMLYVVLGHSAGFFGGGWFTVCPLQEQVLPLAMIAWWGGTFRVFGFTLVSGYIYYYLRYERGKYAEFVPFVKNKVKRLLVPYVAVSVLWAIPIGQVFFKDSPAGILADFGLGLNSAQLWFLLMLFGVFMIAYKLIDNNPLGGGKYVILLFLVGKIGAMALPNLFQIFTACTFFLYFWIGCVMRKYFHTLSNRQLLVWGLGFMAVNVASFCTLEHVTTGGTIMIRTVCTTGNAIVDKIIGTGMYELSKVSGAIMAFLLLNWIARHVNWNNGLFRHLSLISMPVYLFHQQIIWALLWNLSGSLNPYVMALVNVVVSFTLSMVMGELLMKSKYTRFLIGAK